MNQAEQERAMDLKECYARYRAVHPRAHARDAAEALGASEAQLVATRCGEEATRLDQRWKELFEGFTSLGFVKTMTRNPSVVLERWGSFQRVEMFEGMGQVVGEEIDLRLFPRAFYRAFALAEPGQNGKTRRSIQLFDAQGTSIHKVFVEDPERIDAFHRLVGEHVSEDQSTEEHVTARPLPAPEPEREVDREAFHQAWDAMKDTHEFFGLLRKFGVTRPRALRIAGNDRALPVEPSSLEVALRRSSKVELPIMLFVGNGGMIQIHSGNVRRIEASGGWLNVLDAHMNLHVRAKQIAEAWVVRKPTRDGIVSSLELFDPQGETALLVFGKRKPGTEEDPRWRELLAQLEQRAEEQAS